MEFRTYQPDLLIDGKRMQDHLRCAVSWWHTFGTTGSDPFGMPTMKYPWDSITDPLSRGLAKIDAGFEFISRLRIPFYCFHDVDLVDEGDTPAETDRRMRRLVDHAKQWQKETGIQLLWGTANLTGHPRYMNGAATNPDLSVVARAALQVQRTLDATIELGGANYVFWGGREGYLSLHNTDMRREKDHYARFLEMARDYGRKNGFTGPFLIEPKPMEPSKHQYDYDAETVVGFLRHYGLDSDFKLNIEVNHATLAGHSFTHDLQVAADAGLFCSIDANRGDEQNGWDTDQFPINILELTEAMLVILQAGGFTTGGINFDAKVRRNSIDPDDRIIAHISGMDAFAKALLAASSILKESPYLSARAARYASFDSETGRRFEQGGMTLPELAAMAASMPEPVLASGRQEWFESVITRHI
jgi:xylose isomerase